MAQPIDDRVLLAAKRAVARARGQEISVEPVEESASPSTSAKLYRVRNASESEADEADGRQGASAQPAETHRAGRIGHRSEAEAGIVVPRGETIEEFDYGDGFFEMEEQAEEPQRPTPDEIRLADERAAADAMDALFRTGPSRSVDPDDILARESDMPDPSIPRVYLGKNDAIARTQAIADRLASETAGGYLDSFFAQLRHCGVRNAVISPALASAPLAIKASEHLDNVHVNIDERSAGFYALGLAKATGNVVVVICGSESGLAALMPAVLEAEASRVPLMVLSARIPASEGGCAVSQECDPAGMFGGHVKKLIRMPLPSVKEEGLAFARQAAMDACIAAHGALPNAESSDGGPVHLSFDFECAVTPARCRGSIQVSPLPAAVIAGQGIMPADVEGLFGLIAGKRAIALCGEGTCGSPEDARVLLNFAHMRNIPLLADPLSGLRSYGDSLVIDNYDSIFGGDAAPHAEVVIRFGRWPISDYAVEAVRAMGALQIVVDMRDTRDGTNSTDLFVRCAPTVFAEALTAYNSLKGADRRACDEWRSMNKEAACLIRSVRLRDDNGEIEGAYVYETLEAAPADSLVWCANGMSAQLLDTFYCKSDKQLRVLCNRSLNCTDGSLSSALGAAQVYGQTTLIVGDISLLRDANALALQHELHLRQRNGGAAMPSVIVVLLNNNGSGGYGSMRLRPDDAAYERLFLTPQSIDFKRMAEGFGVTLRTVSTVNTFRRTYASLIGEPGISIIEVKLPLAGAVDRNREYRSL